MKRFALWIVVILAMSAQASTANSATSRPAELKPQQQQARAATIATQVLTQYHYKAVPLDDSMSERVFDNYLKTLDPERLYFVQADIDELSCHRTSLDDAIAKEDLSAPFEIFNRFTQRVSEQFAFAQSLLKDGFDFAKNETYSLERSKSTWPASDTEMRELWQKRVKNDWLALKLAGKDDDGIRAMLAKRYEAAVKRMAKIQSADAFFYKIQVFFSAYLVGDHENILDT